MPISIRKAAERDWSAIVKGARQFAKFAGLSDYLPNDVGSAIKGTLSLPEVVIYVAEYDDEIVGGIGVIYAPFIWNPDVTSMDELFFWVYPHAPGTTALRLLRHAEKEADRKNVRIRKFNALARSPKNIHRIYKAMGMTLFEYGYMRFS